MQEIVFIVSPSLGILDSYLPILVELKKRRPDVKITAVIPKIGVISEADPNDTVIRMCESVLDEVVFRAISGSWASAKTLAEAKLSDSKNTVPKNMLRKLRSVFGARNDTAEILNKRIVKAICFDVFSKTKTDTREILDLLPNTPRFSICHGLAVEDAEISAGDYDKDRKSYRTTAYLYSKHEIAAYRKNYNLKDDEIKITGAPRHEPAWINQILHEAKSDLPPGWDRYIFLMSRPAIAGLFLRRINARRSKISKNLLPKFCIAGSWWGAIRRSAKRKIRMAFPKRFLGRDIMEKIGSTLLHTHCFWAKIVW